MMAAIDLIADTADKQWVGPVKLLFYGARDGSMVEAEGAVGQLAAGLSHKPPGSRWRGTCNGDMACATLPRDRRSR